MFSVTGTLTQLFSVWYLRILRGGLIKVLVLVFGVIIPQVGMLEFDWLIKYLANYGTAQGYSFLNSDTTFLHSNGCHIVVFHSVANSFDRTVLNIHCITMILTFLESAGKPPLDRHIDVLSSIILSYKIICYYADNEQ